MARRKKERNTGVGTGARTPVADYGHPEATRKLPLPKVIDWCTVGEEVSWMKRTIQVRIFRGERKYVAECLDLPIVTESETLDALAQNIRDAVALHLEGENLAELGLSPDPTILATMELEAVA